jgi:hypothetical protein
MRGRRAFVILTLYLFFMSVLILLVYAAYAAAASGSFGPSSRDAGKAVFAAVLSIQVILVVFIGPAFTAGAITGEKERLTYDLLRTTLLSANSVVAGKLVSALSYVLLLIISSIPLQSIAFLLGGIAPIELVLSQLLIVIAAVTFSLIGLFYSTLARTTLVATISTFATTLGLVFVAPILVLIFASIMSALLFGSAAPGWPLTAVLIYAGLLLAATNLPATLILSDIFLVEEGSLFFFSTLIDGRSLWLFSPWFFFALIYIVTALLLYWLCVRRIRRTAEK